MKKFIYDVSLVLLGMGIQAAIVSAIMGSGIVKVTSGSQAIAAVIFFSQYILAVGIYLFTERAEKT